MAKKKPDNREYDALRSAITSGEIGQCYLLYGEERYLLERCANDIRRAVVPDGDDSFNLRRYTSPPSPDALREAVDTMPFFAERTLVEIQDYDFSRTDDILPILRELPEHVCLLFICGADFKLDRRLSSTKELVKLVSVVEFHLQEQSKLVPWVQRHFAELGRNISPRDAEYLTFVTGGLMASLLGEIEKLAAHSTGATVTRDDIDTLVAAVPEAVIYALTDAAVLGDFRTSAAVLTDLIAMREPAHKISYSLTSKFRSLLLAQQYLDERRSTRELMDSTGIRYEFQARNLQSAARRATVPGTLAAIRLCCDAAFRLNDGDGPEALVELLAHLAARKTA